MSVCSTFGFDKWSKQHWNFCRKKSNTLYFLLYVYKMPQTIKFKLGYSMVKSYGSLFVKNRNFVGFSMKQINII